MEACKSWKKAIGKIRKLREDNGAAYVVYHRKWERMGHCERVEDLVVYNYQDQICVAINTEFMQIHEGDFIVDEVVGDWFFTPEGSDT